jgi:hypothetical protein
MLVPGACRPAAVPPLIYDLDEFMTGRIMTFMILDNDAKSKGVILEQRKKG